MTGESNVTPGTVTVVDVRILNLLRNKDLPAEKIAEITGLPQNMVNNSLMELYKDGRVGYKKE